MCAWVDLACGIVGLPVKTAPQLPLISCVDLPQLHKVLRYVQYCSCPAQLFLGRRGRRRKQAELTNGSVGRSPPCMLACHIARYEGLPGPRLSSGVSHDHARFGHCRGRSAPSPLGWDVWASQRQHLRARSSIGPGSLVKLAASARLREWLAHHRRQVRGPDDFCPGQASGSERGRDSMKPGDRLSYLQFIQRQSGLTNIAALEATLRRQE